MLFSDDDNDDLVRGQRGRAAPRVAPVPAADHGVLLGGELVFRAERQRSRRDRSRRILDAVGRVLTHSPPLSAAAARRLRSSPSSVVVIAIGVGRAAKMGQTAARLQRSMPSCPT